MAINNIECGSKMNIIILGAQKFQGADILGTKVFYTFDLSFLGEEADRNEVGILPAEAWINNTWIFDKIKCAPALYTGNFEMTIKKGKPMLNLIDLDYVEKVKLIKDIADD